VLKFRSFVTRKGFLMGHKEATNLTTCQNLFLRAASISLRVTKICSEVIIYNVSMTIILRKRGD
jgi:hypothetical protein